MAHPISKDASELFGSRIHTDTLPPPDATLEFEMASPLPFPLVEVPIDSPGPLIGLGTSIFSALESAASRVIETGGAVIAARTPGIIDEHLFGHDLTPDAGITLSRDPRNDFIPDFLIGQSPVIQQGQDNFLLWILLAVLAAVALGGK